MTYPELLSKERLSGKRLEVAATELPRTTSEMKAGYALLLASSLIYAAVEAHFPVPDDDLLMIFFLHYFLALGYTAILIHKRSLGLLKSWKRENISSTIILLNLFLISAYGLNRVVSVFEDSTPWLCVFIVVTSVNSLSYHFFDALPAWTNRLQHAIMGMALLYHVYLALFVAPYYVFGCIGIIGFGIGAHIFIPLLFIRGSIALIQHTQSNKKVSRHWISLGALFAVITCIGFVIEWQARIANIEKIANQSVMYPQSQLPVWVKVGQEIENDWITLRILKSDLVYTTAPDRFDEWDLFTGRPDWEESRKHDPFVFLGSMKTKPSLSEEHRIKILKAISNAHHQTEERLWSGEHLTTSYIVSDVDIYPHLRLAYTEKYFNIRNDPSGRTWRNTEEALYTFQLPEGSVCTSLSLWINGIEEKGILTSKQKANDAYRTIVGVERRDPAVVHWQEGNTVTVRVFPCTPDEERKFKIGITSPLPVKDGRTYYKNIGFYGPNASDATETMRIRFIGASPKSEFPDGFTKDINGDFISEHRYDNNLEISFPTLPLKDQTFTFDGSTYFMQAYTPTYERAEFKRIYLDLNQAWSKREVGMLKPLLQDYEIWVYKEGVFVRLADQDWSAVTEDLRDRNFSIFPFHLITDTDRSLVVTKGDEFTPHLRDFKESTFGEGVRKFFGKSNRVKVYNLAGGIATYINSLRELRALQFCRGDIDHLKQCLDGKYFPLVNENENRAILEDASLVISKRPGPDVGETTTGPDHIARLFAYKNIMRQVGAGYFSNDFVNDALVKEASAAYVVSPVSSLIVLESQSDYERFDITDTDHGLYNASKQSSGAVPEPHEWALIVLFILFVFFVKIRS